MRELGVRSLAVTCELCHHEAVLPADKWSDAVQSAPFGREWSALGAGSSAPTSAELAGDEARREVSY
jgi:hypothetical protein